MEVLVCDLPGANENESQFLTVNIGGLWVSSPVQLADPTNGRLAKPSSDYLLSSAAPVRRPGRIGALSGPLRGRTCVPGFLDAAEPFRPHESGRLVLPSAADTASALRMTVFRRSIALPARAATDTSHDTSRCPAHGSRWKRFVTPFLPPDSHRLSTSELA